MARFLGEGIDPSVAEQIKARGAIMSRSPRNESDLRYLNQRTGWVRVTSMVNVGDSSEEAKKLILQGGTVRLNGDSLTMRGGISLNGNTDGAYSTTGAIGTRPMPGITSFNIVSKNRFGTIREANVEFNVWSLEDLKLVEQLYFRAGYSCVIEWGHSVYVKNDGTVENARTTPNYKKFFDESTRDGYQVIITNGKKNTDHNYDGLIGLIKNFSWSFRKDGGYNCSISVISLGEVIESIKATRGMADFKYRPGDDVGENEKLEEDVASARKSPFHLLAFILEKSGVLPVSGNRNSIKGGLVTNSAVLGALNGAGLPKLAGIWGNIIGQIGQKIENGGIGNEPSAENLFLVKEYTTNRRWFWKNERTKVYYFSLRTFLAMINRFYLLKDQNEKTTPSFYTDSKKINKNLTPEPAFRSYKGHYSADPWVVLLPQPAEGRQINGLPVGELGLGGIQKNIYDLVISIPYVVEKLDPLVTGKDAEFNIREFVQSVLDGLEAPLGGINDFDITYDEEEALYVVVDRNNIKHSGDKMDLPELNLTGLSTTAIDLSLETKITKNLVSSIAIAAQAEPKGYAEILASQVQWNKGYIDRVLPYKTQDTASDPPSTTQKNIDERRNQYENLLRNTYGKLNNVSPEYNIEDWQGLIPESIFFQTNSSNEEPSEASVPLRGVVPVEVGFTLDGISSLKIGEVFRIPSKVLPPNYELFSYIITGLEHSIDGGKWVSKIKANPLVYSS